MAQELPIRSNGRVFVPPSSFVEPTDRWVRVRFGGAVIADSRRALLLIQYGPGGMPTYYFPQADVQMNALEPMIGDQETADRAYYRVRVGDQVAERGAWIVRDPPPDLAALRDYVSFTWDAPVAWYEEDEEILV